MKLTKTLSSIVVALALAASAFAVNYDNHQSTPKIYKVGLGSGNAPSAADAATYGLTQGSFVLNTDDDALFIMHATNVYTKISSAGALTLTSLTLSDHALDAADLPIMSPGKILVGNSVSNAIVTNASGLFTLNSNGVASAVAGGMPLSGIATGIPSNVLIYGADTSLSQVALSGPVTVSTSGVTTVTSVNANAIGSTNVAPNSLLAEDYAALSVDTAALTNGAVTSAKIAANTIKAEDIEALAVDNAAITNGAVTGGKIAADTVTVGNISNGNWIITGMSTAQVAHIEYGSVVVPGTGVFTRAFTVTPNVGLGWSGGETGLVRNLISECTTTYLTITNEVSGLTGRTQSWFAVGY